VVFGGPEITGVLVFGVSVFAQETSVNKHRVAAKKRKISVLFVEVILDCAGFIWFLGEWFTGDAILTFNPPAKVDELAPL
jgi:hypothetical protein